MAQSFSYRHLYYFWVVAKEGGLSRGAERLGLSGADGLGPGAGAGAVGRRGLLKPAGRGLALTEAGRAALDVADQIFPLGESLPERLQEAVSAPSVRLTVGISDGLPAGGAPAAGARAGDPHLRLQAHEDEFDDLLGDLALHRLDVVLADRPAPPNPNLRLYSHSLGHSPVAGMPASAGPMRRRPTSRARWRPCPCCCPPPMPRCARAWTPGCTTRACACAWPASLKTAPCSPPSGPRGMGAFPTAVVADAPGCASATASPAW